MTGTKDIIWTQDRARQLYDYNPDLGLLYRKVASHKGRWKSGEVVGTLSPIGYVLVHFDGVRTYAHRVIFLWWYGYMPKEIDHIDHDRANNRITNLRAVTHSENLHNQKRDTKGVLFVPEVGGYPLKRPWRAQIAIDSKRVELGYFATEAEARAAYLKAKGR